MERSLIHVGTSAPDFPSVHPPTPEEPWGWDETHRDTKLWLNPDTGELKRFNTQSGNYDIVVGHLTDGISTSVSTKGNKTLVFTNGLLTGVID